MTRPIKSRLSGILSQEYIVVLLFLDSSLTNGSCQLTNIKRLETAPLPYKIYILR
jgi:hypothetical protein